MSTQTPLRVLVVDDDRINRLVLQAMIGKMGHESVLASGGEEALSLLKSQNPDLVLLDVMMPVMNGYDTARAIRQEPNGQLPIVFLTSLDKPEDIIEGLQAGGDDYFHKPIHYELLQAKIKTIHERMQLLSKLSIQNKQLSQYKENLEEDRKIAVRFMDNLSGLDRLNDPKIKFHLSQAEDFGGDLIAAARSPTDCLHILLADSAGHGLASALTIMPIVEPFYKMTAKGFEIPAIVTEMNKRVRKFVKLPRYVGANIISVNMRDRTLQAWNGGCPSALVLNQEGKIIHQFTSTHLPLGVVNKKQFDSSTEHYNFGNQLCSIFMCSDGVTELGSDEDQYFNLEEKLIKGYGEKDCFNYIIQAVNQELHGQPARDDIAILMVDCTDTSNQSSLNSSSHPLSTKIVEREDFKNSIIDKVSWKMNLILTETQLKHLDVVPFLMSITSSLEVNQDDTTIFLVMSELFNNALDHGLLKLDSILKDHEEGMHIYYEERASRLANLKDGQIEINLERLESIKGSWLKIKFHDSGDGFDFIAINKLMETEDKRHGRGLKLITKICEHVEFLGNGSEIVAYLDLAGKI